MTIVIAVANEKGGVGKSTTAVNLAAGLALKLRYEQKRPAADSGITPGGRVLLVDLDPQMNALMAVGYGNHVADPGESLAALLLEDAPPSAQRLARQANHHPNLAFLPSNNRAQKEASARIRGLPGPDLRLANALEPLRRDYDYIVIDTPPNAGPMLTNAIMAASHLLIPIEMSYQGASGLGALHKTIMDTLKAYRRTDLQILGYLPTMYEESAGDAGVVLAGLTERYKEKVLSPIHRARVIQQANGAHLDIFLFRPPRTWAEGLESSTRATREYARLVDEVMRRADEASAPLAAKEAADVR